ncbi:MAG: methyltransferase domain-containing protein [Pirellulaceae bacterium]|nr:methyltransferase domain-containing protein [Pirellulaceae bacterium]
MSSSVEGTEQPTNSLNVEQAVRERYSAASKAAEPALCCPVKYNEDYLKVLPAEMIERDYGCGDPSQYVAEGETVLDLGSGGGKICYIASQVVGPQGRVIGVDMNDDMLALARKYQGEITRGIGWDNVTFHKARIQDLAHDLDRFGAHVAAHPITCTEDWLATETLCAQWRRDKPLIADGSVDVVISNCVLNLVEETDRRQLFHELHRVLRRGGRAVISDIVCDEPVPAAMKNDPRLWSGCISGAYLESEFLKAFEQAGFYGLEIAARQEEAWATIEGIEFRSLTICAFKGKEGPCMDHKQAVIYNGPWKSVSDDDGHTLRRGERMAVCEKLFEIYTQRPYADQITPVSPQQAISAENAMPFDCRKNAVRNPRETKGPANKQTQLPIQDCCGPDCC